MGLLLNILCLSEIISEVILTAGLSNQRVLNLVNVSCMLSDPNLLLPIGLLATALALLFIVGLLLYRAFKVELALLFRTLFPFFYASTGTLNARKPLFPLSPF